MVGWLRTRLEEQFADAAVTETIGRNRFHPAIRAVAAACVSPRGAVA
jgi:hypothetical protein